MKPNAHILVIRLSAMGDVAITVPVLRALLREHPQLKITVLTRFFYAPMFAQIPNVSVFAADVKGKHKGLLGLWKLSKALKKKGFDAVADLHNVLRSNVLKQFFKTSGIPFLQIDKGRAEKKELTAATHKNFKQLKTTYQRYADVFTNLGYSFETTKDDVLAKEPLSQVLEDITKTNRKVIGIAPFAAFKGKQYPLGLMQDVIQDLKESGMYTILLFGGGVREKELLAPFSDESNCINMIGRCSFAEELALVSNLDLMLAMDSGNAHLAAMYGVPTVTIWGVTHPYAGFTPFWQEANTLVADREKFPLVPTSIYGNKTPKGYEMAIASIPPSSIVEKINALIG